MVLLFSSINNNNNLLRGSIFTIKIKPTVCCCCLGFATPSRIHLISISHHIEWGEGGGIRPRKNAPHNLIWTQFANRIETTREPSKKTQQHPRQINISFCRIFLGEKDWMIGKSRAKICFNLRWKKSVRFTPIWITQIFWSCTQR